MAVPGGVRGGCDRALRVLPRKAVVARVPLLVGGGRGALGDRLAQVVAGLNRVGGDSAAGRGSGPRTGRPVLARRPAVLVRAAVAGAFAVLTGREVYGQRGAGRLPRSPVRRGSPARSPAGDRCGLLGGGPYGPGHLVGRGVGALGDLRAGRLAALRDRGS